MASRQASWLAPLLLLGWAVVLDRVRLEVSRATEGLLRFWPWWVHVGLSLLFILGVALYMRHEFTTSPGRLWSRITAFALALLWLTFPAIGARLPLLLVLRREVSLAPTSYLILAALAVVIVSALRYWPGRQREG